MPGRQRLMRLRIHQRDRIQFGQSHQQGHQAEHYVERRLQRHRQPDRRAFQQRQGMIGQFYHISHQSLT